MDYENEEKRFQGSGYIPPNPEDNVQEPQYVPEYASGEPFTGTPAGRSDAQSYPNQTGIPRTPPVPEAFQPNNNRAHQSYRYESDEWREPSYSEPRETTTGMYTPGICVAHPQARRRAIEAEPVREPRERGKRLGRFLRAACLVLVCVVLSGAASYGIMEYRFNRGDFPIVNQVVLGGSGMNTPNSDSILSPIGVRETGMTAQDIYDMALTQVVGIKVDVPNTGIFGAAGSSSTSSGSGFIISSDGYILTNYHVVEPAYSNDLPLTVTTSDGTEYDAKIIGFEISNDVALIKISAAGLNPAIIANSDDIRVGQAVFVVGNPFGSLVYTMTDGIVSALDRELSVAEGKTISTFQLSAAVNRGNSGGPVYDANGEVLGIVTAKLIRSDVEGIGFAIPINDAIEIASGLIEHGYIAGRPLIGISAQTVSSGHAEYYGWVVGTYVRAVNPDSAAQLAGLVIGDIIIGLGDVEVDSMESLRQAMRRYRAGDTTTLTVWRAGEEIILTITFDEDFSAGQPSRPQTTEPEQPVQPDLAPPPTWQIPVQPDTDPPATWRVFPPYGE